jgi:hypothetical protein
MAVRNVKSENLKKGDVIYKDGNRYTITNILYDAPRNRYVIEGQGGYSASIPKGRTLPIEK